MDGIPEGLCQKESYATINNDISILCRKMFVEGIHLLVPGTQRRLQVYEESILCNRPRDVMDTGILALYTGTLMDELTVDTDFLTGDPSYNPHNTSSEDWKLFIKHLIQHGPTIKEDGMVRIKFEPRMPVDNLLAAVGEMVEQLGSYMPGKLLEIQGRVTDTELLSMIVQLSLKWDIKAENKDLAIYRKDGARNKVLTLRLKKTTIEYNSWEEARHMYGQIIHMDFTTVITGNG